MENQEYFRLYALWTFGLSGLYALVYLAVTFQRHRSVFLIIVGLIVLGLVTFWFRDGGVKQGWDGLDDGLIIAIIVALISVILIVVAAFHAYAAIGTLPTKSEHTTADIVFIFRISPLVLAGLNVVNLIIFLLED